MSIALLQSDSDNVSDWKGIENEMKIFYLLTQLLSTSVHNKENKQVYLINYTILTQYKTLIT